MFILPELPYAADALAPTMSETTFSYHHAKHHKRYVDVTNQIVAEKSLTGTMEELVAFAQQEGDKKLFNNTAQSWNHGFFWECMSPVPTQPSADLLAAIEKSFGDLAGFRAKFIPEGVNHFASGWAWLIARADGTLDVISTHDADTALLVEGATPLLTCDVWEHAYYIDFKNDRQAFLDAWFDKLLNWDFASKQFAAAKAGETGWRYPAPQ